MFQHKKNVTESLLERDYNHFSNSSLKKKFHHWNVFSDNASVHKCNAEGVLFYIDPTDNKITVKKSKLFDCQVLKWPKYPYPKEFDLKLENFNLKKDGVLWLGNSRKYPHNRGPQVY